jgi:hypothetical protein
MKTMINLVYMQGEKAWEVNCCCMIKHDENRAYSYLKLISTIYMFIYTKRMARICVDNLY